MGKKLQVLVVFEFDGIDDPNSPEADAVVDEVSNRTVRYLLEGWIADAPINAVWVDDVRIREGEEV